MGSIAGSPGKSPLSAFIVSAILLLSVLPALGVVAPVAAQNSGQCSAPAGEVCFSIILTPATGRGYTNDPVSFTLTGSCDESPTTVLGNGLPQQVNATGGCGLTINVPGPTSSEEVLFPGSLSSFSFTSCSSDPCTPLRASFYDDVWVTYSYSVVDTSASQGTPNAPTLTYSDLGTLETLTLPLSPLTVSEWTDVGTVSTATNPLYNASQPTNPSCPTYPQQPGPAPLVHPYKGYQYHAPAPPNPACDYRWFTATSKALITRTTTNVEPEYYFQTLRTFSASPYTPPQTLPPATLSTWDPGASIPVKGYQGGVLAIVCDLEGRPNTNVTSCNAYVDAGTSPTFATSSNAWQERWYLGGTVGNTGYYYIQYLLTVIVSPWFAGEVTPGSIYLTPGSYQELSESPCTIGTLDCTFTGWHVEGVSGTLTGTTVSVTVNRPTVVFADYSVTRDAACTYEAQSEGQCMDVLYNWVFLNGQGAASICVPGVLIHRPHFYWLGSCPKTTNGGKYPVSIFPPTCPSGLVCLEVTGGSPHDRGMLFYGNLTTYSADYGVQPLAGAVRYFDVSFVGFYGSSPSSTLVKVCISNNGAGEGSKIEYWSGSAWVSVPTTYVAPAVCTTTGIPLGDLKGTNIAITAGTTDTTTNTQTSTSSVTTTTTTTTTAAQTITFFQGSTSKTTKTSPVTATSTTSTTTTQSVVITGTVVQTSVATTQSTFTSTTTTPVTATSTTTQVTTVGNTVTSTTTTGGIVIVGAPVNSWLLGGLVVSLALLLALLAVLLRNRNGKK